MPSIIEISNLIWSIADSILKKSYNRMEYKSIILPFTLLKRVDDVLSFSKNDVIKAYADNKDKSESISTILNETAIDNTGAKIGFYNYSNFDFKTLIQDPENIEKNIKLYIDSFSSNVKDILQNFNIKDEINKLSKENLLYTLIERFNDLSIDLSPQNISNKDMGDIFENLINLAVKTSNEEISEFITPEDVVKLMTEILFIGEDLSSKTNISVYDPTCGMGGTLSCCKKFILKKNTNKNVLLYGQDVNPGAYAICKASAFLKGENIDNIRGPLSTLSKDQFKSYTFDYIISDPPMGLNWKIEENFIMNEIKSDSKGRFKGGLPRKNDSQFLFIQHMISKMNKNKKTRIAFISSYSPLIWGSAMSGESSIRKWILENDYVETIIALPTQLFFYHNMETYVWILTNEKTSERKNKIQLIDAREEFTEINNKNSHKRHLTSNKSIKNILKYYTEFKETSKCKIVDYEEFGYIDVVVERPMQLNYQVSGDRLDKLNNYPTFYKLDLDKRNAIKQALLTIPDEKFIEREEFEVEVENALKSFDLEKSFIRRIIKLLSKHDETAKIERNKKGNIKPDPELRERKKIPLKNNIDEYFKEKILKYYPDAWIDESKNKIGYEINFKQLMFNEELYFGDESFPVYELEDLVSLKRIESHDEEYDLIIKTTPKKIIYYPHELSSMKNSKFYDLLGCNVKSKKIIKDYLYCYLNSKKALKMISDLKKGIIIRSNDIKILKIPVPDIGTQKEIVKTYWLMDEFFNEMDIWKNNYLNNILNYESTLDSYKDFSCSIKFGDDGGVKDFCHNWRIVYQGLIWPLAYTYLKATKGSKDESTMKNNLIVLFEFLAAFNVIILISGINNSKISYGDYQKIKETLWEVNQNNDKTWHIMHFGGWTTLYNRLRKIYKKYEFTTPIDEKFFKELSSKKYEKLFQKLRAKERNSEAHGGLEDDIDVEAKLGDLKAYINTDIFNILNLYSGLKLYYTEGKSEQITPNIKEYQVMSLNGPCDPPNWHKLKSEENLEPHSLYLYDSIKNSYLKIDNDLIKFGLINDSKQYGIFIYDRTDIRRNVAIYKCYHQKNDYMEVTLDSKADTFDKVSERFLDEVLKL